MSIRVRLSTVFALCLIGFMIPSILVAQTGFVAELEESFRVILSITPDTLVSGGNLMVTILVEYPQASEVSCVPPAIPRGLALRGVRVEPELVPGVSGAERWTRVEYQFDLREAGNYFLDSFSLVAGDKRARTAPINLAVFPASTARAEPALYWSGVPASFFAGIPVILELRASGLVPQDEPVIEVDVPENALLESLIPETGGSRMDGSVLVVARFRLTPLSAGLIRLPQASIRTADGEPLWVRPSQLASAYRVGPATTEAVVGRTARLATAKESNSVTQAGKSAIQEEPAFPVLALPGFLPDFIRISAGAEVSVSRQFWERHEYPPALANLRRAERDTLAGWTLKPLRAEMEKALGLPASFDETHAPRVPLLVLGSMALFLSVVAGFLSLRRRYVGETMDKVTGKKPDNELTGDIKDSVTIFRFRGFFVASVCACVALVSFGRLSYSGIVSGQMVVLSSCTAFRVPDPHSVQSAFFADGECVRSGSRAGTWLYVESIDGRAGWIDSGFAGKY